VARERFNISRLSIAAGGVRLAFSGAESHVTQRNIEVVIGRLLTDEDFRQMFVKNPQRALVELLERGTLLSNAEIAALVGVDGAVWARMAQQIDPRLQKASFRTQAGDDADESASD
jgi:hypothetical protein